MSRVRLLNIVALILIVLVIGVFAALIVPGMGQNPAISEATPTAFDGTPPTEAPIEVDLTPVEPPVQIGNITLTRDITDVEKLASQVPSDAPMQPFTAPTPMVGEWSYIMPAEEAATILQSPLLIPSHTPPGFGLSFIYGGSGGLYGPEVTVAYGTPGSEHSMVINQLRYLNTSPPITQTYPIGTAPLYSLTVRGQQAYFVEQGNLGWIPPFLSHYDPNMGQWAEAGTPEAGTSGGAVWPHNVLLWAENGIVYRVMSDSLTATELVMVAESMGPDNLITQPGSDVTGTPTPLPTPIMDSAGGFATQSSPAYIPEVPVTVIFPQDYILSRNNYEPNRRGTIAAYNFIPTTTAASLPMLSELHVFTYDSIKQFEGITCAQNSLCFDGDYPTTERYIGQYEAFQNGTDFEEYSRMTLGATNYLVANRRCTDSTCFIREYTTFIGEIKIDLWVMMGTPNQMEQADRLVELVTFDANALPPVPTPHPTPVNPSLGTPFTLQFQQTAIFTDQQLTVTLLNVQDSRCPSDVQCVQAGNVVIDLTVTAADGAPEFVTLTLEGSATKPAIVLNRYSIAVLDVQPYPNTSQPSNQPVTVTLSIDQAITN